MLPFSAAKEVCQSVLRYSSSKLPARTVCNFQWAIYFKGDSVKALFKVKRSIKWIELFALQSVWSESITNWGCNGFPGWVKKVATAFNDYFSPYWCHLHSNTYFPGPRTIFLVTMWVQEKVVTFRSHQQWCVHTSPPNFLSHFRLEWLCTIGKSYPLSDKGSTFHTAKAPAWSLAPPGASGWESPARSPWSNNDYGQ